MTVRIVSALIALPVVVALIQTSVFTFLLLLGFVAAVCLYEFMDMTQAGDRPITVALTALGLAVVIATALGGMSGSAAIPAMSAVVVLVLVLFLFRTGEMSTVASRASLAITGIGWAGGLLAATGCLRLLPEGEKWLYLACVLAWGSDTGGYFAGRFLGRHKLYEKVSPKKTWEGSVGGVIVATAGALALTRWYGPAIDPMHVAIVAPIASVLGQLGDLAESLLKRSVGVKDSGKIMPGHGGLLDRVDALLFAGPALLAYAVLVLDRPIQFVSF
jgi:phosphatidate cytidylyltransferase